MLDPSANLSHISFNQIVSASGYCSRCNSMHTLPMGRAVLHCLELIHHFEQKGTIDLHPDTGASNPRLATSYLFGEARGKMFGVLECLRPDGSTTFIRAFSGQYNGCWEAAGWTPPLFDLNDFHRTNDKTERRIKELGNKLEKEERHSTGWLKLRAARRQMSRELMRELHALYRLHNFRAERETLYHAYTGENGIPTGTGDCCAPKLLNYAAANSLKPLSLAEFYWGLDNKSGTKRHGRFYPSCREKCQPILGYLLCGLEQPLGEE